MSTFEGIIPEIPGISVDRFDGKNTNSLIYFLSHCHKDHMQGLEDWGVLHSIRNRPEVYLYASPLSVKILKEKYPSIETKLKELPMLNSTLIKFPYSSENYLTVTPLPAGHCPGSVMFLFEYKKNILYTGDYRVKTSDLKKYKQFYSLGQPKIIHKLYLDTTFFNASYYKLPSRQESLQEICRLIRDWISVSEKHLIKIITSATYGSEYLFMEIAKNLNMPVHVNSDVFNIYKCIPELDHSVTLNSRITQIHSGCGQNYTKICMQDQGFIRTIKPSVLWFKNYNFAEGLTEVSANGFCRVCYSCHASLEEIEGFLRFLKPLEIEPCVVPRTETEQEELKALLNKIMNSYKEESIQEEVKLLDAEKCKSNVAEARVVSSDESEKGSDILNDLLLNSPTKSFKRRRLWINEDK